MSFYVADNILTKDEALVFIKEIREKIDKNPFTNISSSITDKYIDVELSKYLFERIVSKIPQLKFTRPNNLIFTSKYEKDTGFGIHTDTGLYFNQSSGEKTRYTSLIYLNDDFEMGRTIMYDNNFKQTGVIVPKTGRVLVFDIDLFHSGEIVKNGEKYWIGIELIA